MVSDFLTREAELKVLHSSCQKVIDATRDDTQIFADVQVTVNGRSFSIEEINAGIKDTFNSVLYFYGDNDTGEYLFSNKNLVLHKDLEYELYFYKSNFDTVASDIFNPPRVFLVITNIQHPLSTENNPLLYELAIDVTEWGLRSYFHSEGHTPKMEAYVYYGVELVYLGSYTMRIDEIVEPPFEVMNDEWKENTKSELRLYMHKNDFYVGKPEDSLEPGYYHVYVQKFFKSDMDSIVIFEHENGNTYWGFYYFVHENSGSYFANLNKVRLAEDVGNESFDAYIEKVRANSAVSMEYLVF